MTNVTFDLNKLPSSNSIQAWAAWCGKIWLKQAGLVWASPEVINKKGLKVLNILHKMNIVDFVSTFNHKYGVDVYSVKVLQGKQKSLDDILGRVVHQWVQNRPTIVLDDGTAKDYCGKKRWLKYNIVIENDNVLEPRDIFDDDIIELVNNINKRKFKTWSDIVNFKRRPKNKLENISDAREWIRENKKMRKMVNKADEWVAFYLSHQFDSRGRLYNRNYLLNYQGDEWAKASIELELAQQQLTPVGKESVLIEVGNCLGADKESYEKRINIANSYINGSYNGAIDKPILLARIMDMVKNGTPHPVSIDATASGFQILSIMANCEYTARLTNLVDSTQCYDVYGAIAQRVIDEASVNIKGVTAKDIRKVIKKAFMTKAYNSLKEVKLARETLISEYALVIPQDKFENILNSSDKIKNVCEHITNCFKQYNNPSNIIEYTMPDGFVVRLPLIGYTSKKYVDKKNRWKCTIKTPILRKDIDSQWRSFVPNIIHSIDGYICREMIRRSHFDIYTIHDCFWMHPNDTRNARQTYMTILKELQDWNILNYILTQLDPSFAWEPEGRPFDMVTGWEAGKCYALC